MIRFYYSNSYSSRKTRKWLDAHHLEYDPIRISPQSLDKVNLKKMLSLSSLGTEVLIDKESYIYRGIGVNFDNLSLEELLSLIIKSPVLLRSPLVLSDDNFCVGYDIRKLMQFLPA